MFPVLYFCNDRATTCIYSLSLHAALPILSVRAVHERILADLQLVARAHFQFLFLVERYAGETYHEYSHTEMGLGDKLQVGQIGRAHVCTPVTLEYHMPSSA